VLIILILTVYSFFHAQELLHPKVNYHVDSLDGELLSVRSQPKASFRIGLPNGDFLTLTVWPGKSDPMAEVITVQIRHRSGDLWETTGRLAAYRTADGSYSQLPERR
jgi:hypothetical protein